MIGDDPQKFSGSRVMRTIAIGRVPVSNLPKKITSLTPSCANPSLSQIWS
ncbi:hypothetical protein AVEN_69854-1, partial [Araneus ventricosus]